MRAGRNRKLDVAFLAVWMTVWAAAILVALWLLGTVALAGEPGAAVFLAVWVAAAGFALWSAGRRLLAVLLPERGKPRPDPRRWEDGVDPPER